jgi:uncharacterized protein (DUF305 family)
MKPINFKFFGSLLGAVVIGSGSAACSSTIAQNSTPASSPSSSPMQGMDHSNMNHGSMGHNMDLGPADAEFDLRFIDSMIPHHQGAVDMAKEVLQKSKRPELKKLAQEVIAAQDKEISQMQQWRKSWYPKASETPIAWHATMNHSMPMSKEQIKALKMSMDLGAADEQFDLRFINAMIPHHEGAVTMAQDVLQKSKRPEVQKLAKGIIASQEAEINQMKQWRKSWYNQ